MFDDVTVAILTGQRPDLLSRTLESLPRQIREECHFVVFHNSGDDDTAEVLDEFGDEFGMGLRYTCLDGLWPVGEATSMLFKLIRNERRSFTLHLQDDWLCRDPDPQWLATAMRVFDDDPEIGQVRLRRTDDKTRINDVDVKGKPVRWSSRITHRTAPNAPFTLNPFLMRSEQLPEKIVSEVAHMRVFDRPVAQLTPGVFTHIGGKGRSLMRKAERNAVVRNT